MKTIKLYNTNTKTFFFYRIIPGLLTIIILSSPVWASVAGLYEAVLFYLAFIAIYIVYQSAKQAVGMFIGYRNIQKDKKRDWSKELINLDFNNLPKDKFLPSSLKDLTHIVFIPTYKEPIDYMRKTMDSIAEQDYPYMDNVIIVIASEGRAGTERKKVNDQLIKEYKDKVKDVWCFVHPEGIPGEIIGDACANLRWAGIQTSKKLRKNKINTKHTIFTKSDSDARYHPKHLSALTYKYITNPKRYRKFYGTASLIYSNNQWDVPVLSRLFSQNLTLGVLSEWILDRNKKQSFSNYSANFQLLEKINFWDASTGAEDTYFYWNAFLHLNGDFGAVPFFLPLTMDCVEGKNHLAAYKNLYKQQLRWGWGAFIMPIAIQGMVWNKRIKLGKKFQKIIGVLMRTYNFGVTMSIVTTFSIPIMTLFNPNLQYTSVAYNLPRIISVLMTASILFQIPTKYYIYKFYGPPPKEKSFLFKVYWWLLEHFMVFVLIWTYYLWPQLQAQTEIFLGKERKKFFIAHEGLISKDEKSEDLKKT